MSLDAADKKWLRATVREMLKNCAQDLYDALKEELRGESHDVTHVGGSTCATYVHDDNDGARRHSRRMGFNVPLQSDTVGSSVTPDAAPSSIPSTNGETNMGQN